MIKPIERDKQFEKHFKKRIAHDAKLLDQFRKRYSMFYIGKRDYPLNDHALTGTKKGKRAFSVASDIRVIYEERDEYIVFLDIGTHAQVYK